MKKKKKVRQNPKIAPAMQLATQHYRAGRLMQAEHLYRQIIDWDPANVDAINGLGNVLRLTGKPEKAADHYRKAHTLNPQGPEILANLGLVLKDLGKFEEAISCFRQALRIKPGFAELYVGLGNLLQETGNLEDAIVQYEKALSIQPDNIIANKNLGVALKEAGKMDKAAATFHKVLSLRPEYGEAYRNLADMQKHTEYGNDIQKMEKLYTSKNLADEDRMHLAFALGKIFEDLKQYDKAFSFLAEANRLKRQSYRYSVEADRDFFNRIKKTFSPQFVFSHQGYGNPTESAIFILGMPRSGTTLVEQILSSHPMVYGAGELMDLANVINSHLSSQRAQFPEGVLQLDSNDFEAMGTAYLDKIRKHSSNAKFITDKMPHNFLRVGLIKLILPNAKVIHCHRDPMDNCLSIYKNYFSAKESHQYAYNLQELGEYYLLYQSLMEHWQKILPDYVYTLKYEEMIADQRGQTEKLLSFCNLPWNDACLEFHRVKRRVQTASWVQVRQPVYTDSLQLWKRYEHHLEPLRKIFNR